MFASNTPTDFRFSHHLPSVFDITMLSKKENCPISARRLYRSSLYFGQTKDTCAASSYKNYKMDRAQIFTYINTSGKNHGRLIAELCRSLPLLNHAWGSGVTRYVHLPLFAVLQRVYCSSTINNFGRTSRELHCQIALYPLVAEAHLV